VYHLFRVDLNECSTKGLCLSLVTGLMALGSMALGSELAERRCRAKALAHRICWPSYTRHQTSLSPFSTSPTPTTSPTPPRRTHTSLPSRSCSTLIVNFHLHYLYLTPHLVPSTGCLHQGRQNSDVRWLGLRRSLSYPLLRDSASRTAGTRRTEKDEEGTTETR
jgi:hypothetical protein